MAQHPARSLACSVAVAAHLHGVKSSLRNPETLSAGFFLPGWALADSQTSLGSVQLAQAAVLGTHCLC